MLFTIGIGEIVTIEEKSSLVKRGVYDIRGFTSMDEAGEEAKNQAMISQAHSGEIAGRMMLVVTSVKLASKPDDILEGMAMQAPASPMPFKDDGGDDDAELLSDGDDA